MRAGWDTQLLLALGLVALGSALFCWHLFSRAREAGLMISESRVPRRYLLLGVAAGLGILYIERH